MTAQILNFLNAAKRVPWFGFTPHIIVKRDQLPGDWLCDGKSYSIMSSQNNATPSPKKVAFSPVRVGSAELQCHSMTPPQSKRGTAGTPRSILKISNSPIYSHENDVSIVLDSSTGTGLGSQEEIISLETCIQNLLVAKEEDRLHTYSALYNALKSGDNSTGIDEGMLRSVVKIILKDMESSSSIVM